jgi:ribosome maturation factor RimP
MGMPFERRAIEGVMEAVAREDRFTGVEIVRSSLRREHGAYVVEMIVDREGGVDTDLCEAISRALIRGIDGLEPPVGGYRVEVASAGLDRPLLTPEHFRRFAGRVVKVITTLRIANRTEFNGTIGASDDTSATILDPHAGPTQIPFAAMKRANLVFDPSADLKRKR